MRGEETGPGAGDVWVLWGRGRDGLSVEGRLEVVLARSVCGERAGVGDVMIDVFVCHILQGQLHRR